MANGEIFAGTSGIVLPVSNKLQFPPEYQDKSRLTYYASLFNSLEINSPFYKVPQAKTVERWSAETAPGFKFTFKLWQGITHNKDLAFNEEDVRHFMEVVASTGSKKGCLLVQFPASIHSGYADQLDKLLTAITKNNVGWQVAVEFRSKTWYNGKTYRLIEKHAATLVIHDMPSSATPLGLDLSGTIYLRFHGPGGRYGGSYDDSFLAEYAGYISDWLQEGKTVYIYFNNTRGSAINNLKSLQQYLV